MRPRATPAVGLDSRAMGTRSRMDTPENPPAPLAWAAAARHRVLIIGSGFGGLFAAQALRRSEVDVTLLGACGHNVIYERTADVVAAIERLSERVDLQ